MAKFSIMNTISYGFQTYIKHFMLLACVALTLGVASWATRMVPRWAATSLGIYKAVTFKYQDPKMQPNAPIARTSKTGIHAQIHKVGLGIGETVAQKVRPYIKSVSMLDVLMLFAITLIMSLIWMWLHIGGVRVLLDIRDKNKSVYDQLFSQKQLVIPYILLSILYTLLMVCAMLGIGVAAAILEVLLKLLLTDLLGIGHIIPIILAAGAGLIAFFVFVMRYVFAFYVLIDKKKGAYHALATSYDMTRGNILRLAFLLFIITLPFTYPTRFIMNGTTLISAPVDSLGSHIFVAFIGVFYGLCFVYAYRQLSDGGKKA